MSFLGCVGHLMAATGLTQVLEVVYAENAVKHILSEKLLLVPFKDTSLFMMPLVQC